jgi:hypothetical protein
MLSIPITGFELVSTSRTHDKLYEITKMKQ